MKRSLSLTVLWSLLQVSIEIALFQKGKKINCWYQFLNEKSEKTKNKKTTEKNKKGNRLVTEKSVGNLKSIIILVDSVIKYLDGLEMSRKVNNPDCQIYDTQTKKKYKHTKMSYSVVIMIIMPQKLSENKISFVEKMGLAESLKSYRQALAWFISVDEPTYLKNSLIKNMVVHC